VRFLESGNADIRRYLAKKHTGSPADHDIDREAPLHQSFRELQHGSLQASAVKAMEHERDPSTAIRILQLDLSEPGVGRHMSGVPHAGFVHENMARGGSRRPRLVPK
jgi:hypothetical protein